MREIEERSGKYTWRTYLVQGWKDDRGRWVRKKFRDRSQAEAFMAVKRLEVETRGEVLRPIISRLSQAEARDAEVALARLKEMAAESAEGASVPSLLEAVEHFAKHWRVSVSIEAIPLREARAAIVTEAERAGKRSASDFDLRLRAFERWLALLPRYRGKSVDPDWSPAVHEIGRADVAGYVDGLRNREGLKAAPKTRNNVRANLHAFFERCRGIRNGRPIPGVTRRWCVENPAAHIAKSAVIAGEPQILSVEAARALMRRVEKERGGMLVLYFALATFAGVRPGMTGELSKLAAHPGLWKPCKEAGGRPLIDLERGILTLPGAVAKTGRRRVVSIQGNLREWLVRYRGRDVLPAGAWTELRRVRRECGLSHDVCRHSFISYLCGLTGSKARAALEAGNSENIVDRHYLSIPTAKEAGQFFGIFPTPTANRPL